MRALGRASIFVAALTSVACGAEYMYRPTELVTAEQAGLPAARYALPPERPVGTVLVTSSGIAKLDFAGQPSQRMLVLRFAFSNNSDTTPWKIDTRNIRLVVPGAGESQPAYVNAEGGLPPSLEIPAGEKRTVELFYPLPQDQRDPKHLPKFDVLWQVDTSTRPVAERTPFERIEIAPDAYAYPYDYAGSYWPYWWYDPLWPGPSYVIAPGFVRVPATPSVVHSSGTR